MFAPVLGPGSWKLLLLLLQAFHFCPASAQLGQKSNFQPVGSCTGGGQLDAVSMLLPLLSGFSSLGLPGHRQNHRQSLVALQAKSSGSASQIQPKGFMLPIQASRNRRITCGCRKRCEHNVKLDALGYLRRKLVESSLPIMGNLFAITSNLAMNVVSDDVIFT